MGVHPLTDLGAARAQMREQRVFERFELGGGELLDLGERDEQGHGVGAANRPRPKA